MHAVDYRSHAVHYFRCKYKQEAVAMTVSSYLSITKIWILKLPLPQNFKLQYFYYLLFIFLDFHL